MFVICDHIEFPNTKVLGIRQLAFHLCQLHEFILAVDLLSFKILILIPVRTSQSYQFLLLTLLSLKLGTLTYPYPSVFPELPKQMFSLVFCLSVWQQKQSFSPLEEYSLNSVSVLQGYWSKPGEAPLQNREYMDFTNPEPEDTCSCVIWDRFFRTYFSHLYMYYRILFSTLLLAVVGSAVP